MNWTEPAPPTKEVSDYDHVVCNTPLGVARIEWKSWKNTTDFDVYFAHEHVGTTNSLDDAKKLSEEFVFSKYQELREFVANFSQPIWFNTMFDKKESSTQFPDTSEPKNITLKSEVFSIEDLGGSVFFKVTVPIGSNVDLTVNRGIISVTQPDDRTLLIEVCNRNTAMYWIGKFVMARMLP